MKKITEYTEQEILALTDDQLEAMVKLEMAEQGVKILSMPTEPQYEALPAKTETSYSVSGFSYQFLERQTAEKLSQAIKEVGQQAITTDYNYSQYDVKWLKPLESYTKDNLGDIKTELYYKKEIALETKSTTAKNDALKSEYQTLLSEYNEAKDASNVIRDEILGAYYAVQRKYYDYNVMADRYNDYLSIADSDKDMAMKFLKKAYSVSEDTEDYIIADQKLKAVKPPLEIKETAEVDDLDLPNF